MKITSQPLHEEREWEYDGASKPLREEREWEYDGDEPESEWWLIHCHDGETKAWVHLNLSDHMTPECLRDFAVALEQAADFIDAYRHKES